MRLATCVFENDADHPNGGSPFTSTASTKHQLHFSPGSLEVMMGCDVAWKCFRACRFFESSQHPTCPQVRQTRRCTQVSPIRRHSAQPRDVGRSVCTESRCVQGVLMDVSAAES
jgi:hypothetical protein